MVSTKMLLGSVSPVMQLFLRFTIAYFALRICYPQKLELVEKKEEWYCSGQYEWSEDIFQYKDLLVGCAALSWGVYSFMLRKITARNYDMLCCTRRIFFYGLISMLPILPFVDCTVDLNRENWIFIVGNLLYLGLFASAFCYAVWNRVSEILGIVKTNLYLYGLPVVTFLFAAVLLKERVSAAGFCGIIFTIAGLILSERKPKIK